jgi:hypothetical protein
MADRQASTVLNSAFRPLLPGNQARSRANLGYGTDLSLCAAGVTNQACWVALFFDSRGTLRVDFREKSETGEPSRMYQSESGRRGDRAVAGE